MILWNENIDEYSIVTKVDKPEIIIDFSDLFVLNSSEIRKLLIIQKKCTELNKKLILKTQNEYLKDLLIDFGFDELDVDFIE